MLIEIEIKATPDVKIPLYKGHFPESQIVQINTLDKATPHKGQKIIPQ